MFGVHVMEGSWWAMRHRGLSIVRGRLSVQMCTVFGGAVGRFSGISFLASKKGKKGSSVELSAVLGRVDN